MTDRFDSFDTPEGESTGGELLPPWASRFLELLVMNGSVSASARLVGMSRTTIYKLAARAPTFRRALDDAKLEFRDLLLGEAHKRAIHNQSDRVLCYLLGLYFPQKVDPTTGAARVDPSRITDDEIAAAGGALAEDLELAALSDEELATFYRLAEKAAAPSASA